MDIKEDTIDNMYEKNQEKYIKKTMGKYYTPKFIIEYIIKNTISNIDIVKNPFVKIIDPSCGAGYFLLALYDLLESLFKDNIINLKEKYKSQVYKIIISGSTYEISGYDYWKIENIHYHILTHCIYGADIDASAVELTIEELRKKRPDFPIGKLNIIECDSLVYWEKLDEDLKIQSIKKIDLKVLIHFWSQKYDFVIGNPPYIGHKKLSSDYKAWLLEEYEDVFKDKSDISFCFFKRIKDILATDGIAGIISSRYFMESPTGISLRKYLMENIRINQIVDFYGKNIFKDVGVATAIYFFQLKGLKNENYYIDIHKLKEENIHEKQIINIEEMIDTNLFESFKLSSKRLKIDRWMIIPESSYIIYKKIQHKTNLKLKDIAISFQGIITGCDKAFVVDKNILKSKDFEREVVKTWIKNKNIGKYYIEDPDLYLIYSNNIENPADYPNSMDHISKYKEKLESRRECKSGIRKWYYLQWSREEFLFDQEKIVFPYKSKSNKFAIDYNGLYFSADIYGLILKEEYKDKISLEYLVGILNSKVYEFYFKLFAKKMGRAIYDYYPNTILELNIITKDVLGQVEKLSKEIISRPSKTNILKEEIEDLLMDYFDFNKAERNIIKNAVK